MCAVDIYGEIELLHFLPLLRMVSKEPNLIFWDLGCGRGKAMIAAAMSNKNFKKVCGVELLDGLHELGATSIEKLCKDKKYTKEMFKLIKGDIKEIDWSDPDIIYPSSVSLKV